MVYAKYIKIFIKSQLQYQGALWATMLGHLLMPIFYYLGVLLYFARFDQIAGWSLAEVSVCYGIAYTGLPLAECLARGFNVFERLIVKGDFDRVMLRPLPTVMQVLCSDFSLSRFARIVPGVLVLARGLQGIEMPPQGPVLVVLMVLCSAVVFGGLFVIGAAMCFFTTEGLEVMNVFTYGGQRMASYPMSIYERWIVRFLTFVVPIGCFNYLPMMYITGRVSGSTAWLYAISPVLGMLFILPCLWIWNQGVKHYLSTGS